MDEALPECARPGCGRSEPEHQARDRDQADDVQVRIWRALGWPCAQFVSTFAAVCAENQAATGRWSRGPSREPARPVPAAPVPAASPGLRGAALAREALNRALLARHDNQEAS